MIFRFFKHILLILYNKKRMNNDFGSNGIITIDHEETDEFF